MGKVKRHANSHEFLGFPIHLLAPEGAEILLGIQFLCEVLQRYEKGITRGHAPKGELPWSEKASRFCGSGSYCSHGHE